jgi:hypothetical protein
MGLVLKGKKTPGVALAAAEIMSTDPEDPKSPSQSRLGFD